MQLDLYDEIKVAKCQVNFKTRRCATLRLHARARAMRNSLLWANGVFMIHQCISKTLHLNSTGEAEV